MVFGRNYETDRTVVNPKIGYSEVGYRVYVSRIALAVNASPKVTAIEPITRSRLRNKCDSNAGSTNSLNPAKSKIGIRLLKEISLFTTTNPIVRTL